MFSPLINQLKEHLTEDRWESFQQVLAERTRYITIALEDLYQPHNASACLRTCDCFGIQDLHIIENRNEYLVNPEVALGSSNWLSLHKYCEVDVDNSKLCMDTLKSKGYMTVATSPHVDAYSPENLPLDKPVAILLGNEGKGLSEDLLAQADYQLAVPMYGFTESFNISVTAAMILHRLTERIRNTDVDWALPIKEQEEILLKWFKYTIKNGEDVIAEHKSRIQLS